VAGQKLEGRRIQWNGKGKSHVNIISDTGEIEPFHQVRNMRAHASEGPLNIIFNSLDITCFKSTILNATGLHPSGCAV
jgi:hypothetical protein